MYKLWALLLFFFVTIGQSTFAQNKLLHINTSLAFHSKHFLGLQNGIRSSEKVLSKFNIKYNTNNLASQLALNHDEYNNFSFDRSYIQYTSGVATFGAGTIDRHWSFSDTSSLILSHNARPFKSIYLKFKNDFAYDWLPSEAKWSLDVFNGFNIRSVNVSNSMLLGLRATLSIVDGLNFELFQTSQWGGDGYDNGISDLGTALIFDSNDSSNANINKMAGFGISYLISENKFPLRIYGQAVGEDEAGNLPSCFSYLAGLEWENTKTKYPITFSIEAIDTRIGTTNHGFCGPNTLYNNNTYDYTNYGKTMGAGIDTEGTSLAVYLRSQLSQEINIKFATKSVVINDKNWHRHRLSSVRQSGLINSLGISWDKNNISFNGNIYTQDFNLNRANIKKGYGVGFSSSIVF